MRQGLLIRHSLLSWHMESHINWRCSLTRILKNVKKIQLHLKKKCKSFQPAWVLGIFLLLASGHTSSETPYSTKTSHGWEILQVNTLLQKSTLEAPGEASTRWLVQSDPVRDRNLVWFSGSFLSSWERSCIKVLQRRHIKPALDKIHHCDRCHWRGIERARQEH